MTSLLSYAKKDEVESFFSAKGVVVTCEQDGPDVYVTHTDDIFSLILEEGRKAWEIRDDCLRFDTCIIFHSDTQNHPCKVVKGYYSARNYRIRNSLGPAF